MEVDAVHGDEHKGSGQAGTLVSVGEPLGASEAHQVGRGQVGQVSPPVVRETMLWGGGRGEDHVPVKETVAASKPLDLSGVDGEELVLL